MARRLSQAPDRGAALDTDRVPIYRATLGSVEGVVQVGALRAIEPSHIQQGGASTGQVLKWNGTAWAPGTDNTGGGGGGSTFVSLDDTPASYSGSGGFFVRVNTGASALEFLSPAGVLSAIAAAPASHTHAISDVTGLQTALDGKVGTAHPSPEPAPPPVLPPELEPTAERIIKTLVALTGRSEEEARTAWREANDAESVRSR